MHPLSAAVAEAIARKGAKVDVTEGPVSVEYGVIEIPIFITTRGADPETVALSVGAVPESGNASAISYPISTAPERVVRSVTDTAREAARVWAKAQQRADQEEITHGLGARGETVGERRRKEAALDASLFSPDLVAAPAPVPDPDPRLTVYYSPAGGILIKGTQREDAQAIKRLSSPRFRWSGRQQFWYVPRSRGGRLRTQGEIERIRDELAAAKGEPVALDYRRMQKTEGEVQALLEARGEATQPAAKIDEDEPDRNMMTRAVLVYDEAGEVTETRDVELRRGELARWYKDNRTGWSDPRIISGISHKRNALTLGPKGKYDLWLSPQEVCPESFFQAHPDCAVRPAKKEAHERPARPWLITADQYQAAAGVHQPWIAEISPAQYGALGKRAKREYDEKRAREWAASADIKAEWETRVLEAFNTGDFTRDTPGVSKEALTALYRGEKRARETAQDDARVAAREANRVTIEALEIGDQLFDILHGKYGSVTKKLKRSVWLEGDDAKKWKADVRRLQRLSHGDLIESADRELDESQLEELGQEIKGARAAKKAAKKTPKKKPAKAKKKKKTPKKRPGRPPARARGRARERYVDPVTGQDVPGRAAGAVATGDYIARARARKDAPLRTVEIQPDELGPASYQIDLEQRELELRAQERGRQIEAERAIETELAKLKGKQALPGVRATFRTAGTAAKEFLRDNEFYYAPITGGLTDITVAVEDWASGQVVWVPRKGRSKGKSAAEKGDMRRLAETTKGAKILSAAKGRGLGGNKPLLLAVLTWIFSQAKTKRYADVPWTSIESLNDQLDEALEMASDPSEVARFRSAQSTPVYPASSGRYDRGELVRHPDVQASPRAVAVAEADANLDLLTNVLGQLEAAYAAGRRCLAPEMRRTVLRRLRYLKQLEAHPHRIASADICAHARTEASAELLTALAEAGQELEEYDPACTFPLLIEDTRRLAQVCEEGYEANWPAEAASEWSEHPERYETRLQATPPAVLRRVATQRPLFTSDAPPAPTYHEAENQLDEAEFEIFGPADDVEIPF